MFLIQCMVDRSLCIVEESQVVCDGNVVKIGDAVMFWWQKKSYEGEILERSEDHDFLVGELKKIQKGIKTLKTPRTSQANEASLGKRKSKKPTNFSASDHVEIEAKKKTKFNKGAKKTSKHDNQSKSTIIRKGKNKKTARKMERTVSSDTSLTDDYTPNASKEKENLNLNARAPLGITCSRPNSSTVEELEAKLRQYEESFSVNRTKSRASSPSGIETSRILKASNVQSPKISKNAQSKAGARKDNLFPSVSNDGFSENIDDSMDSDESSGVISTGENSDHDDAGLNDGNYALERFKHLDTKKSPPSNPDEIDDDEDDEAQLFGQNYAGGEVVLLQDGIYCRKKVYKLATGSSHLATHVARKLLEGVFKFDKLIQCTLTGQSARAQGKDRQVEVSILHAGARDAIIEFAKRFAKQRQRTEHDNRVIRKAMAQKLVELKQMAKKNAA